MNSSLLDGIPAQRVRSDSELRALYSRLKGIFEGEKIEEAPPVKGGAQHD